MARGTGTLEVVTADGVPFELTLRVSDRIADGLHLVLAEAPHPHGEQPALTGRQEDVLRLLCDGATNQQIATALGIAEPTVQKHIAAVKERLGASTRAQVVALALQRTKLGHRVGVERLYVHQAIRGPSGRSWPSSRSCRSGCSWSCS